MSLERWKVIEEFPDYKVSTWGRIYSTKTGKFLIPEVHDNGYLRVDLFNDKGKKHVKIHRLVAEAFIPKIEGKPQINHIDGNPQNNSISNLEWVDNAENHIKAWEIKRLQQLEEQGIYNAHQR